MVGDGKRWVARRYHPGDEIQILQLRRLVFGDRDEPRNTETYWRWEFRDNPAGHGSIWLAVAGNKVVGQYAVIPVRVQYRDEVVVSSLCLEVMTHPDYRRQAVFSTLGSRLHEELEKEGIPVTYGFPNRYSVQGLVSKLGWIYICCLRVFVKPFGASRIAQIFKSHQALGFPMKSMLRLFTRRLSGPDDTPLDEGGEIKWIDRFDERIDVFWEHAAPRHRIAVVRDSKYLNWRYFDNPGRQYRAVIAQKGEEILGYVILRCMKQFGLRGGMIVDLEALPNRESVLSILLREAENFLRGRQMDLAACLINGDDKYVTVLSRRGFLPLPKKAWFKEWHFECRLNTPAFDMESVSNCSDWFLTFGDTDVI
jgi:GNAT superfamily N-acetyltransferase